MGPIAELTEAETRVSEPTKVVLEGKATLGAKGRLVIPQALREALGLEAGSALDMYIEDGELRMSTQWGRIQRAQERARKYAIPGRSIVDEFLAERRAEALAEDEA